MEFLPQLLTLASVLLIACISPGPDFIAVTSHALASRKTGIGVALGVGCGCLLWAMLAVFGLGLMLTQISWLYQAVRYFGAAYLVYLGILMLLSLRRKSADPVIARSTAVSFPQAVRRGLMVNLTNPKSVAFFGSLFVTILPQHAPLWVYAATLTIVWVVAAGWFCILASLFSMGRIRALYLRLRRPFDAVMGGLLVGIGARLALDR